MAYRRGARRPSKSEVVLIRTTTPLKMLIGLLAGLFFAFGGALVLLFAAGADSAGAIIGMFLFGLLFLIVGTLMAIGSVVEIFTPTRVYIEDDQLIINKKQVLTLAKMTFVPLADIQGALVDTKLDHDTDNEKPFESYRVVLALNNGERVPLADYHYISNMDEARKLAGRIEEMLKDARGNQ